jgi:hypothetical protein
MTLTEKRQQWCDSTSYDLNKKMDLANSRLSDMRLDLEEQQAAAEEAGGSLQQLQSDLALVERTISQTKAMKEALAKERQEELEAVRSSGKDANLLQSQTAQAQQASLLNELIVNKEEVLASLQGQQEVILLAHAQLKSRAAEIKRRVADRSASGASEVSFATGLSDICRGFGERAQSQAIARAQEMDALQRVVDQLGHVTKGSAPVQQAPAADDSDVDSFLQFSQGQITADDVLSLLGGGPMAPDASSDSHPVSLMAKSAVPQQKIGQLLAQVKSDGNSEVEMTAWCHGERERNELSLRLAQDLVDQLTAEIDAHHDAEDQLSEAADALSSFRGTFNSTVAHVEREARLEIASLKKGAKDRALSVKILDQAAKIVQAMESSGSLQASKGSDNLVALLQAASQASRSMVSAAATSERAASAGMQSLAERAQTMKQAHEHETQNLELLVDEHVSQRGTFLETQRAYQAEVDEAKEYLAKLTQQCGAGAAKDRQMQRTAQVRALEDARSVLDGKKDLPVIPDAAPGNAGGVSLRGASSSESTVDTSNMSPLERAALEIGVAVN